MARTWRYRAGGHLLLLALTFGVGGAIPELVRAQEPAELAAKAKVILTKHCLKCHGQEGEKVRGKPPLKILDHANLLADSRKLVIAKKPDESLVIQRVEDAEDPMPPKGPRVPEADLKVLRAWIAAGAPTFVDQTAARPAPSQPAPAPPTDLAVQAKAILTKHCLKCHGQEGEKVRGKPPLKILDHANLLADKRKLVVAKKPGESLVITRIEDTEEPMPPSPKPPVPPAEIKILRAWIAAGAPAFTDQAASGTTPSQPTPVQPAQPAKLTALDQALLREAPRILAALREKGYKNVGVLKFRIQRGKKEPASDNVGPLNQTVATRLEIAMVLANDLKKPTGIIQGASEVAVAIPEANHLTKEGRKALFKAKYPLAWGENSLVDPDAFITGGILLEPNLRGMTIQLLVFGKNSEEAEPLGESFAVLFDAAALVESGESFLLRGAFDDDTAIQVAATVKTQKTDFPLQDKEAPVALEVRYDGKPVPVEFKDGKAQVPEPKEGQKVSFVLRRQAGNDRLGIVLKVNGESTLFHERLKDVQCQKWILQPDVKSITIDGFQTDQKKAEEFQVQSLAQSKEDAIRYGLDVGTVSLVVFREQVGKEDVLTLSPDAEDLAALSRGAFPREKPKNLDALRAQLREDGRKENSTRGLIASGKKVESAVEKVEFKPNPTPVMAATIAYYKP